MIGSGMRWGAVALAAAMMLAPMTASANVTREGTWPASDKEKKVTLKFDDAPRKEAILKLASAAGWSVVLPPLEGKVDVAVTDQPADKVLEVLLAEGKYVAKREGSLIYVSRSARTRAELAAETREAAARVEEAARAEAEEAMSDMPAMPPMPPMPPMPAAAPAPPEPPAPPVSGKGSKGKRGEDRFIAGGSLRIEAAEEVGDVTVMGGSAVILGHVKGDVAVMGGSVKLEPGSEVDGDVSAVGGQIEVKDGAKVDGDLQAVGGRVIRAPGAIIGGDISSGPNGKMGDDSDDDDEDAAKDINKDEAPAKPKGFREVMTDKANFVGSSLTNTALLFAFGAILLALGSARMDRLKLELAARPMRCFALGVIGAPASLIVLFAVTIALVITIVGIPLACLAFPMGFALLLGASAAGVSSALQALGEILVRHKTQNPYAHLAVGCLLLFVLGLLPFIGSVLWVVVALMGLGAVVATRGAGLIPARFTAPKAGPSGDPPYRSHAEV